MSILAVLIVAAFAAANAQPPIQIGDRPFSLIPYVDDPALKAELQSCATNLKSYERKDFSIGHRGACLQYPEHTLESYSAAIVQGAGIVECDVTFTKDRQLVCRHAQCDLHTTTNVLSIPALAAKCTRNWIGPIPPNQAPLCCTSDFTLAEIKTMCAKMDSNVNSGANVAAYLDGTAKFRTDANAYECPRIPTHKESIALIRSGGGKYTPELKTPEVPMPFEGNYTQQMFAQQMINEYIELGVPPANVWPQSFLEADVYYWVANTTYGNQAVSLDGDDSSAGNQAVISAYLDRLVAGKVKIVAPPTYRLVEPDTPGGKLGMKPSFYAQAAKARGLGIITWTLERSGNLRGNGGYYYDTELEPNGIADNNGDVYVMMDTLYREVGVIGIFSDWPATVTFYSNCVEQCRPTYTLYNATSDAVFATLKYGATVPCIPAAINIRATFPCEANVTGPVTMRLFNSANTKIHERVEGQAPYYLYGDSGTDVIGAGLPLGSYSISSFVNGKQTQPFFFNVGARCP